MRNQESRLIKLEQPLATARPYMIRVSSPITVEEQATLSGLTRPVAIMPHKCQSSEEWTARYAPRGTLQ